MPLTPGSLAACLSTASACARLILSSAAANRAAPVESPFNKPSILFRHASLCACLLSPVASSQIPAPGKTFAETPLLEVCPAKVGLRHFVFHQQIPWVSGHHLCGSLHSSLDVERIVTAIWGPRSGPQMEYAVSVPSLRLRYSPDVRRPWLDRQSCSVTTTASDDEFSRPRNTPGWNLGSHVPPFAGLAGIYRIISPNSRIGVLSLRPCSLSSGVLPSLPMSHLFIKYAANSTNQHSILASGGTLATMRCSSAAFSVLAWPATRPIARLMIPLDRLSPTGGLSGAICHPSWRACAISSSPKLQLPARCRT